ncbi:Ubiquitin-conjugating enzyme E2 T [Apophysomyces sp. BC1034]|nr:Ubiquitin-conjugating enzyme E2 T [Apophysomyces sp. BC1015]KAG0182711.1 Ubiquitin-conjugating enzyme E2 T [Apophysomyces sp. BC1021]KAG0191881.1 Ubiquitin-conjugating enzyme E2 T [Apophysomyces sp. BC1034]
MASNVRLNRLNKELDIKGPPDSPYEKGLFQLEINIPQQYPFHPPQIRFKTPIYHPNIDENGRICADILKQDGWKPSLNLSTTLISLSTLMACPNPDDPLDADIAKEYTLDHAGFIKKATEYTLKHAVAGQGGTSQTKPASSNETQRAENAAEQQNVATTTTTTTATITANTASTKSRLTLSKKKQKSKASADQDEQSAMVGNKRPREDTACNECPTPTPSVDVDGQHTLPKSPASATQVIETISSKQTKKSRISLSKSKKASG